MNARLALAIIPILLATGCPKNETKDEPREASTPAPSVSVATPESASATPPVNPLAGFDASMPDLTGPSDPRFIRLSLFEKLAVEKANRPATTSVENVFDAIDEGATVKVSEKRQLAGFPLQASYCARGETLPTVDITVCEFRDAASYAKGKEASIKAKTPRKEMYTSKTTLISVTRFDDKPDGDAEAKRIVEALKKKLGATK